MFSQSYENIELHVLNSLSDVERDAKLMQAFPRR